jgi:spore maturation protein CgeB
MLRGLRKRLRARQRSRALARESEEYHSRFSALGLTLPDDGEIRRCLSAAHRAVRPGRKGSLKIISIYHDYNWEGPSLGPALERFGTTRHYDWGGLLDPARQGWDRAGVVEMNADLLDRVERWVAEEGCDLIFCYLSGALISAEAARKLSSLGSPTVNLSLNDKESFVGARAGGHATGLSEICRHFDLSWTSTRDALEKYRVEGALPVYLPEGANPDVHRPHDVPRDIDVSFVGQRYGNRPDVIRKLERAGIRPVVHGPGWPAGPLPLGEMVRLYSRSRINLGFGGVLDHTGTFCLKGRDFEVPMSGGLYLTEDHEELGAFFDVGREIFTYSGFDDLVDKIRWLLAHPELSEAARRAGRERALLDHTWESRFERVFRLMGVLPNSEEAIGR